MFKKVESSEEIGELASRLAKFPARTVGIEHAIAATEIGVDDESLAAMLNGFSTKLYTMCHVLAEEDVELTMSICHAAINAAETLVRGGLTMEGQHEV